MPIETIILLSSIGYFGYVCWCIVERFKAFTALQWDKLECQFATCFQAEKTNCLFLRNKWELEFQQVWHEYVEKDRTDIFYSLGRIVMRPTLKKMLTRELYRLNRHLHLPLDDPRRQKQSTAN